MLRLPSVLTGYRHVSLGYDGAALECSLFASVGAELHLW